MTISAKVLSGPRLKIERAYRHIDELRQAIHPLRRDLYTLKVEKVYVTAPYSHYRQELVYVPEKPIPELLAIIVGDAVHNLRSALDHLAGGIIRTLPEPPGFRPFFPMHPKRENLVTDKSLGAIEQALPGAKEALLEKIRPENGADEWLWSFNDLSNLDKHNLIIPSVAVTKVVGSFRVGTNTFTDCGFGGDAAKPIKLISTDTPIAIDKDFETAVDVTFGKGDHAFEGKAVIPTLTQIGGIVSGAIEEFENLIKKAA